jgi:hypothetical protein
MQRIWIIILILGLFSLSGCGEEPEVSVDACGRVTRHAGLTRTVKQATSVRRSEISTNERLYFHGPALGAEATAEFEIRNVGEAALHICGLEIKENMGGHFDNEVEFRLKNLDWKDLPITVEPGMTHTVLVTYAPINSGRDRGSIIIQNNSWNNRLLMIPILTQERKPGLFSPQKIYFGRVVPVDDPEWSGAARQVIVQNTGFAPLRISDIFIRGNDKFRFTIPLRTGEENDSQPDPTNRNQVWPDEIAPNEFLDFYVWFKPDSNYPEAAELVIESNDPDRPEYVIDLIGNGEAIPWLEVSPYPDISFTLESIDQVGRKTITLKNISPIADLAISEIGIWFDMSSVFSIDPESLSAGLQDDAYILAPGEEMTFDITFKPNDTIDYRAELVIKSNDHYQPEKTIQLSGVVKN